MPHTHTELVNPIASHQLEIRLYSLGNIPKTDSFSAISTLLIVLLKSRIRAEQHLDVGSGDVPKLSVDG